MPSAGRERTGAWRGGFLLGALEVALKEDLRRHLRTVQQLNLSLDLIGIDWTRMWLQADGNYGSVMITPDFLLRDCLNLVANLREPRELARMIAEMERARTLSERLSDLQAADERERHLMAMDEAKFPVVCFDAVLPGQVMELETTDLGFSTLLWTRFSDRQASASTLRCSPWRASGGLRRHGQ